MQVSMEVEPAVCHLHCAVRIDIGKCIEEMGDLIGGDLLGLVVGAIDAPDLLA